MRISELTQIRFFTIATPWIIAASVVFASCPFVEANFTGWDFEDGTLQGWTLASASTIGPTGYTAQAKWNATPSPTFWDPLGYNSKSPAYGFAAAPSPFDPERSHAQDAPIVLRSPTFALHGGGQIIAHMLGGMPQPDSVAPSNFSDLSGPSIDTAAASGSDTSYQGISLRRDSNGDYVLHKARTSNSSSYTGWQQMTFTEAELAGVIASYPGELFTLDLIDTAHGQFSSLNLDSISIPQPAGASLIQGGGMWTIRERLSADTVNYPVTSLASADALMELLPTNPAIGGEIEYTASTINIHDAGPMNGHFANDQLFVLGRDRFATAITGNINVLQSGLVTFGFYSNAGGRLRIDGNFVAQDNFGDLACDTLGTINLTAGVHEVEFLYFEDTGMETLEVYVATQLGEFTSVNDATFELLVATDLVPPDVPGDYNDDGKVDAADYVLWRKNPDAFGGTPDGYNTWRANFGDPPGSGSGNVGGGSVPEPTAGLLWLVAVIVSSLVARRLRTANG
jgi:hypothetical protein